MERATLDEREMQFLYKDGDDFYFMDTSSYEQIHISSEALERTKAELDEVRRLARRTRDRDDGSPLTIHDSRVPSPVP